MSSQTELASAQRRERMISAPLFKLVPAVALPMVVSMLIESFYNLADTYFVSFLGTTAVAAVGVNNSLMNFVQAIGMCFALGAASYISRLLGGEENEKGSKVAATALYSAIALVSVFAVFAIVFRGPLVTLLGATDTVKPQAEQYAIYILSAAPFTVAYNVLYQALRAEGSTRYSMIGTLSGCLLNLALDPLFIFVFKWGVSGAALATALSKVVSVLVLLIPYLRGKSLLSIRFRFFSPVKGIYFEIFRMGIPNFLRSALMTLSMILLNNFAGSYGDSVLAAVSIANRVMMFLGSMVMGLGQGFQPIAGYCWGARAYKRVKDAFWVTSLYGLIVCVAVGTTLFILAPKVAGLFTKDDLDIISVSSYMIRVQCLALMFHVWVIIINGIFQATGKAINSMILGLSRQGICLIPSLILLNTFFGLNGLMVAQAISDTVSMFIAVPMLIHVIRTLNGLEAEQAKAGAAEEVLEEPMEEAIEKSISEAAEGAGI